MLSEAEFASVAQELKARAGAVLSREMNGVAEQKLTPLARREGFSTVSEFLGAARMRQDARLWSAISDALVQSDSRFFRDRDMFKRLRTEILPALAAARGPGRPLRIWSAGCGAGQEAYSLAMIAEEWRQEGGPHCEILASDFSERLLDKARSGLYTQFEVQRGLPIRKLIANFEKAGDLWRVADRLRGAIKFEAHNLLHDTGRLGTVFGGAFDVVLCRYVLSPMDAGTRGEVISRIANVAAPDAVLIMGENETPPDGCAFDGAGGILSRNAALRAA